MMNLNSFLHCFLVQAGIHIGGIWQASLPADILTLPGQPWPALPDLLLKDLSGQGAPKQGKGWY